MSRQGKLPVEVPSNVEINILDGKTITVKGPKGELQKSFDGAVSIEFKDNQITVKNNDDGRFSRAMLGTARSIINSMVKGVVQPFSKDLEINGVGFKAELKGKVLFLYLGYSHDIKYDVPDKVNINIEGGTKLKVESIDKQLAGQVASDIKSYYKCEPYKMKGVRIIGEPVIRKEGKKTA